MMPDAIKYIYSATVLMKLINIVQLCYSRNSNMFMYTFLLKIFYRVFFLPYV